MSGFQTNTEYFFRVVYECLRGACYGSLSELGATFAHLWVRIVYIGYGLSIIGLLIIVYCTVRLFELRKREHEFYSTLIAPPEPKNGMHPRWERIQELLEGNTPSEWKEAIIEADIMLDDVLSKRGYTGEGVGEKLKSADKKRFATLQNAWEAHKVRNLIAHQGSSFELSESLAGRTIAHYEAVFREFKVI